MTGAPNSIRVDLVLVPADEGRRRTPFSGAGVLRPGQVITMHEDRTVAGTAVVLDSHSHENSRRP
ncbi:hypothetical protein [Streptomyces venezuelae]